MSGRAKTILYIRLPCWKIYPGGVIYVADYVHKRRPDIDQHLLDLAVVAPGQRRTVLRQRLHSLRPDIVAYSWRNMQSFGPHPEDDALDQVINFDYSPSLLARLKAAWGGLSIVLDYTFSRIRNFSYMRLTRRALPEARIVVGGTAVTIFGKYVAAKCPPDTVVVIGEGEDTMLSIADGFEDPVGEFFHKTADGRVIHRARQEVFDLASVSAVDFPYVASIFPSFADYLDGDIGVHTKRGCPYQCHFCLYNKIEGSRQRFRDPVEVVNEIERLNRDYGVKQFWFTDAQFCSTPRSTEHVGMILDEILARRLEIRWSGYIRLNFVTLEMARKMLASGMASLDLSFTGSQEIIDILTLGYSLDQQMAAFQMFKEAGHTDQKIKLYIPLNAPGETEQTLRKTIDRIRDLYEMFGRDNVLPFIFFIGIQPNTPVEKMLIETGYLKADYNPLTMNPFTIKRLLYNPPPLGGLIASAYLEATQSVGPLSDYIGRATMDIIERKLADSAAANRRPAESASAAE